MKKILGIITALAVAGIMLVAPVGTASSLASLAGFTPNTSSDFYYMYNSVSIQLGPVSPNSVPNGLPLCRSASLGNIVCYTPKFVRKAYNVPSTLDGSGQTIVIVDAFGSITIQSDLQLFDFVMGLPDPPSFTIFCGDSPTPLDSSQCNNTPLNAAMKHDVFGWAIETSLDVEYAHSIAPGANIVLDVSDTNAGNSLNAAETSAIAQYPGAIFSQSFGIPEIFCVHDSNRCQISQAQANYATGAASGDTFFASAGDSGATFGTATQMGNFPSSDVHNVGVAGTQGLPYNATGTLQPCPTSVPFSCTSGLSSYHGPCVLGRTVRPSCKPDGYGGEQVWNEPSFGAATGGAQSLLIGVPSYQAGLGLTSRGPDVTYNAAIDGGVLVVFGGLSVGPVLFIVGGTSAGSPQWAGIAALANQARANAGKGPIGDLNPVLYGILHSTRYASDFHDITVGNDQLVGTPVGYSAGPGYDVASGIGSPNVANLVTDIAAA